MYLCHAYQFVLDEMPDGKIFQDVNKVSRFYATLELIEFNIFTLFKLGILTSGLEKLFHIQIHSSNWDKEVQLNFLSLF